MDIETHDRKCPKALRVDMTTVDQVQRQGWGRVRLFCLDGHSAYSEEVLLPRPARIEAVKPLGECVECGGLFEMSEEDQRRANARRRYCADCLTTRTKAGGHYSGVVGVKPPRLKHCGWCHKVIRTGKYCDLEHQRAKYYAKKRVRELRDLEVNGIGVGA